MEDSDLAELTLMAELYKLEGGFFADQKERDALIVSALESLTILKRSGEFSGGEAALQTIEDKLRSSLPAKS